MPGSFPHLFGRFFDFVFAGELTDTDLTLLRGWLSAEELEVFLDQDRRDQTHGFRSGLIVATEVPLRPDLIRAAVMHDIGKNRSHLGAIGRTIASILIKLHLPLTTRMTEYRDHGPHGAVILRAIGSPEVAVAFADAHHRHRPPGIDANDWDLLQRADRSDLSPMSRGSGGQGDNLTRS